MKMLNEMNPKLRAFLAAGLIGTASLGAASCSMPTDDPYDPVPIEQPAPETPSNPDNPATETPENPGDTEDTEEAVTEFDRLCAELFDSAHLTEGKEIIKKLKTAVDTSTVNETNNFEDIGRKFVYQPNKGFDEDTSYSPESKIGIDGFMYVIEDSSSSTGFTGYIIPTSVPESIHEQLNRAIAAL